MSKTNETITRFTLYSELPELLKPNEVMSFLGAGRNFVYGAIKSGKLPHRKIGGRFFIPKSAVEVSVA